MIQKVSATEEQLMSEFALKFPVLRSAPGVRPWVPEYLVKWISGPAPCEEARHAARFLLWLWDDKKDWGCPAFDVMAALQVWDKDHRTVFLEWANNPWWPTHPGVKERQIPAEHRFWEDAKRLAKNSHGTGPLATSPLGA